MEIAVNELFYTVANNCGQDFEWRKLEPTEEEEAADVQFRLPCSTQLKFQSKARFSCVRHVADVLRDYFYFYLILWRNKSNDGIKGVLWNPTGNSTECKPFGICMKCLAINECTHIEQHLYNIDASSKL